MDTKSLRIFDRVTTVFTVMLCGAILAAGAIIGANAGEGSPAPTETVTTLATIPAVDVSGFSSGSAGGNDLGTSVAP